MDLVLISNPQLKRIEITLKSISSHKLALSPGAKSLAIVWEYYLHVLESIHNQTDASGLQLVAISVDKFSLNLTILQSTSSSSCPVNVSTHRISTSLSTPLSISTSRRRWYDSGDYLIRKMEGQNQLPQTPPSTIRTKICTMSLRQSTAASAMHVQEIRKLENLQDKVGGGCKPCTRSSAKGSSALCIIS